MSPSATTASRLDSQRLPIPRAALSALDQCRRQQSVDTLNSLANVIIQAAFDDGRSEGSASLQYVMRRLLTGVSVSSGASRLNYSAVLVGLIRQLSATVGSKPVNQVISSLVDMYGENGSFDLRYAGAERERALGALAGVSAISVAVKDRSLSATACKKLIALLRRSVEGNAGKWRLTRAVARVLENIITAVKMDERNLVVTTLWRWCQERRGTEDGLQIAFALHNSRLIDNKGFKNLYPNLAGGFEKALMDTFEGGFSSLEFSADQGKKYTIPHVWETAVRYILTPRGSEHLGSIHQFWKSLVLEKLVLGSRSGEKKLLAIELIPIIVAELRDPGSLGIVFGDPVASMVEVILSGSRSRTHRATLRKNRISGEVLDLLANSARSLGKRVAAVLSENESKEGKCQPTLCGFLKWAVHSGIWNLLFPPPVLTDVLSALNSADEKRLLCSIIEGFARPNDRQSTLDGSESATKPINRHSSLRFLFTLARQQHDIAKDVISAVCLYCCFPAGQPMAVSQQFLPLKTLNSLQSRDSCTAYGGILPELDPDLPLETAAFGFRRMVEFLASQQRVDRTEDVIMFTAKFLLSMSSSEGLLLELRRNSGRGKEDSGETTIEETQRVVTRTIEKVSEFTSMSKSNALSKPLKLIAGYLCLHLYDPQSREGAANGKNRLAGDQELFSLFQKVELLADHLAGKRANWSEDANVSSEYTQDEERSEPTSAEYIAQLIAHLCGRGGSGFRHVSIMAIEALDEALDDSVVSVLFDAIETCLSGENLDVSLDEPASENDDEVEVGDSESESIEIDKRDDKHDSEDDNSVEEENERPHKDLMTSNSPDDMNRVQTDSENSEVDVDVDIDREDPAVLAEFDRRVSSHLRLLQEEKKAATARKLEAESRFTRAARLLDTLEAVARKLRMRLEKGEGTDSRVPIVFLDLHVRLYEFVLGDDKNFRFLKQACHIISRQMLISTSVFVTCITDKETVSEVIGRFFDALVSCEISRHVPTIEARTISKSAGFFMNVSAAISGEGYSSYLPVYKKILAGMLGTGTHFWHSEIMSSFILKAPLASLKLSANIVESFDYQDANKSTRKTASAILLTLSTTALQLDEADSAIVSEFWKTVRACLLRQCVSNSAKLWSPDGFCNMMKVAANGLRSGRLWKEEELVAQLSTGIETAAITQRKRSQLLKSLRVPNIPHTPKRSRYHVSEEPMDNIQQKKMKVQVG